MNPYQTPLEEIELEETQLDHGEALHDLVVFFILSCGLGFCLGICVILFFDLFQNVLIKRLF